jgi:hypothetical protein
MAVKVNYDETATFGILHADGTRIYRPELYRIAAGMIRYFPRRSAHIAASRLDLKLIALPGRLYTLVLIHFYQGRSQNTMA